eukprot:15439272-Alexandrium_andersonii.AAC.1
MRRGKPVPAAAQRTRLHSGTARTGCRRSPAPARQLGGSPPVVVPCAATRRPVRVCDGGRRPAARRLALSPAVVPDLAPALPQHAVCLSTVGREGPVWPVSPSKRVLAFHPGASQPDGFASPSAPDWDAPGRRLPPGRE